MRPRARDLGVPLEGTPDRLGLLRFQGGIGTPSRHAEVYTIGVLVQCNCRSRRQLRIGGVMVGPQIAVAPLGALYCEDTESIIIVMATDAPLWGRRALVPHPATGRAISLWRSPPPTHTSPAAMVGAETMTGVNGHPVTALPHDRLRELVRK